MEITSITIVYADGSIVTTSGPFAPVTAPALPSPEDVEIDVVLSDGSPFLAVVRSAFSGIFKIE
jgi:hypothetical protein